MWSCLEALFEVPILLRVRLPQVVIFLSNVLIAQLIGAYSSLYDRMLGLARLNRKLGNPTPKGPKSSVFEVQVPGGLFKQLPLAAIEGCPLFATPSLQSGDLALIASSRS